VNDVNGVFVGYSYIKETDQRGGYTLYNFTNFSDFNDLYLITGNALSFLHTPTTSYAYKRGLLKDRQVHDANNNLLSETQYNYATQTTLSNEAYGMRVILLPAKVTIWNTYGFYSTAIDNYFLTSVVQTDHQQYNAANPNITSYVRTTTTYAYEINATNKWAFIQTISTTDSKSQAVSKRFYYSADTGIPLVTTGEQQAITAMISANRIGVPVHEVDTRNGIKTETHNAYAIGFGFSNNGNANTYLASIAMYNTIGGVQIQSNKQQFNYDQGNYNVVSASGYSGFSATTPGSKAVSTAYSYNLSYPIAKVENASSNIPTSPCLIPEH